MTREPMNDVELDVDAELATIAAIGDTAGAAAEAAATEAAGHDPAAWRRATDFIVDVVGGRGCPNWELEQDDRAGLSEALAGVLDHYLPGGPNGIDNWHPLYRLAFVAGAVTLTRGVDWERGAIKPLHKPKAKHGNGQTSERDASLPSGDDAVGENRKRFTMGGG
jgi:hypothetical protein